MDDKRSLVIYYSAGAMSGIFSSGLTKAFEEAGLKSHIHSVYGNSAGGLTAVALLADQTDLMAHMYWEDLNEKKYIRWSRLGPYLGRAFCNAVFRTRFKVEPIFDIDYIQSI